jgi:L-lactate dehydrogenase complex protein LldG
VTARDEVLARIRTALAGPDRAGSQPDAGRADSQPDAGRANAGRPDSQGTAPDGDRAASPCYRTRGDLDSGQLLDLLAERIADYRAVVRRCTSAELADTVGAALTGRGAQRVVVPAGLELPVLPAAIEIVADDGLSARDLDALDGVITGSAVAIAETGTIILDGSPDQGRRAITLVPDYHLCIVHAAQVVEIVPEAIALLGPRADRPLTWISGPSATSDIELKRVEGVHGPRTLEVILVGP